MITSCEVVRLADGSVKVSLDGVKLGAADKVVIEMVPPGPTYAYPEHPTVSLRLNGETLPVAPNFHITYIPELMIEEDAL